MKERGATGVVGESGQPVGKDELVEGYLKNEYVAPASATLCGIRQRGGKGRKRIGGSVCLHHLGHSEQDMQQSPVQIQHAGRLPQVPEQPGSLNPLQLRRWPLRLPAGGNGQIEKTSIQH